MANQPNDALLMSGVGGAPGFHENLKPSPEIEEAKERERQLLNQLLPTAQKEVDDINRELSALNTLTEFVKSCGDLPANLDAYKLQVKLEARYAYMSYLTMRKTQILNNMSTIPNAVVEDNVKPAPAPALLELVNSVEKAQAPKSESQQTQSDPTPKHAGVLTRGLKFLWRLLV